MRIRRLRLGNQQADQHQTAQLAGARVPGFLDLKPAAGLFLRALERRYGIDAGGGARATVGTVPVADADLLGLAAGTPAFIVEREHRRRSLRLHHLGHARRSLRDRSAFARRRVPPTQKLTPSRIIQCPISTFPALPPSSRGVEKMQKPSRRLRNPLCRLAARISRLVHLYGSGHSVLRLPVFPRYGFPMSASTLTDPRVMAQRARRRRRTRTAVAGRTGRNTPKFLDHQPLNKGDSIIIFGRMAAATRRASTPRSTPRNMASSWWRSPLNNLDKPATPPPGMRLADAADLVIDTCSPIEDAIIAVEGWSRPVSGSSTVLAMIMARMS